MVWLLIVIVCTLSSEAFLFFIFLGLLIPLFSCISDRIHNFTTTRVLIMSAVPCAVSADLALFDEESSRRDALDRELERVELEQYRLITLSTYGMMDLLEEAMDDAPAMEALLDLFASCHAKANHSVVAANAKRFCKRLDDLAEECARDVASDLMRRDNYLNIRQIDSD